MKQWICIIVILLSACQAEKPKPPGPAFTGLEKYFNGEVGRLAASGKSLEKTLVTNEKTEVHIIDAPNWNTELRPFLDTFKGNRENAGAYYIDSLEIGTSRIIKYAARDSMQEIRNITVFMNETVTDSIIINKAEANSYYKSSEKLTYSSDGSFVIHTMHDPVIGKQLNILFIGKVK
jgi:hypothetical protein